LQREANGEWSLAFDYRVDVAPTAPVELALECGPQCRAAVAVRRHLVAAKPGEWHTLRIRLSCFQQRGANMRAVAAPFVLSATGPMQLAIANVRLDAAGVDVAACE
jgi:beta-glucosidase